MLACALVLFFLLSVSAELVQTSQSGDGDGVLHFNREDRDYRPLQFGKRDDAFRPLQFGKKRNSYRPLQFGKRAKVMHNHEVRAQVNAKFEEEYRCSPLWTVRCPGRVNLIGEHIDYSGYGVLPMAIQQSTYLAVGVADDGQLHLANIDPSRYAAHVCHAGNSFSEAAPASTSRWHHYFIAGWRGMLMLGNLHVDKERVQGLQIVVGSTIPPSAGLSSSSALVCASALATYLATIKPETGEKALHQLGRTRLAEIATAAERYVGTEGGGMDQACECLADKGSALRIDFNPLQSRPVRLPPTALFAVVHSGVEMNKAATTYYNERVVECRIAAQMLVTSFGSLNSQHSPHPISSIRTLKQAQDAFGLENPSDMLPHVERILVQDCYARNEVRELLGMNENELCKHSLNNNTQQMQLFKLKQRARHVFSEAQRVLEFEQACMRGDANAISKLAELMNQSHRSCAEDFECSCPELDQTVKKCLEAGCIGARLTGAGWGGCCVVLVEKDAREIVDSRLNVLFWTEPSGGIEVASSTSS